MFYANHPPIDAFLYQSKIVLPAFLKTITCIALWINVSNSTRYKHKAYVNRSPMPVIDEDYSTCLNKETRLKAHVKHNVYPVSLYKFEEINYIQLRSSDFYSSSLVH